MKNPTLKTVLFLLACGAGPGCAQEPAANHPTAALVGEKLPFAVGDTLNFTSLVPIKSNVTVAQNAKILEIVGKWILVKARIGGSDDSFWINVENILLLRIEQPAKN